jgi:acetyl esterase/lipase
VTVILLIVSAVLLFVSLWIVVPAPNMALLVLGVGAPELSPALCTASVVILAVSATLGAGLPGRIAIVFSLGAVVLTSLPIIQFGAAVGSLDAALSEGFPHTQLDGDFRLGQGEGGQVTRSRRFSLRDFVFGVATGSVGVTRGIVFAQPDGQPLSLDVYRPIDSATHPVVVQLYGGAWQRGAPADNEKFARWLTSRGYTVFAIDYRHAPRWQWPAQRDDVSTALAWIASHAGEYGGDASRLALVGRSAGAQLALVAAYASDTPKISAVVSFYGPTDLVEGWRVPPQPDPLPVRPTLEAYLGGTPQTAGPRYRDASPVSYVSSRVPPTLLLYGTRDHVVEARFGRDLRDRLRAAGAVSVLLEIPWAEHAFDLVPNGLGGQVSLYYVERFLDWTLKQTT